MPHLLTRGIIMDNKKELERRKQEDIALNRALLWFGAAMVLEFLLLLINKYYVNFETEAGAIKLAMALTTVLKVTCVLGFLGGAAVGVLCWKRMQATGELPFVTMLASICLLAVGGGSGLIVLYYAAAVQLLYMLVPAGAVLALVYYLYQKDFFLSALGVGVGLLGLWLVRRGGGTHPVLVGFCVVAGAVFLLAVMLLAFKLRKGRGVLEIKGKSYSLLPAQSNFMLVVLSCQISLLAMLAGLLLGGTVAFYLLFALVAWLFVLLVYYTVKMM